MSSIQRYIIKAHEGGHIKHDNGGWVTYADARAWVEREVQEAEQRGWKEGMTWRIGGPSAAEYWESKGAADEQARIYKAVEALIDDGKEYQAVMLRNVLSIIDGNED